MTGKREATKLENSRKLIEATIDSIAEHGLSDTTISTVVERAGLSRGIVSLRFDSKDALLVETLRFLADEWRRAWQIALRRSGDDPARQLHDVLLVVFEPPVFSRKRLSVWHAFWADSKHRAIYKTVCATFDREYRNTLERLCRELSDFRGGSGHDASLVADTLSALVNGLWLDLLTVPRTVSKERARAMCQLTLCQLFPHEYPLPGRAIDLRSRVVGSR